MTTLKDIEIIKTTKSRLDPALLENPGFGTLFSDHMFSMDYADGKWGTPRIVPFGKLEVSPALTVLHYGQAISQGVPHQGRAHKHLQAGQVP
jgi:branched-chain amino acid aminotransferase